MLGYSVEKNMRSYSELPQVNAENQIYLVNIIT